MEKPFSLLIALDIKRQFNKAASGYILPFVVCILILSLAGDTKRFLISLQTKNFRWFV